MISGSLLDVKRRNSVGECQALCAETAHCLFFSSENKSCYLWSSSQGSYPRASVISGHAVCPTEPDTSHGRDRPFRNVVGAGISALAPQTAAAGVSALPLQEMASMAVLLAQSGFLDREAGGKNARVPDPGMGVPRVRCLAHGMTCCVPNSDFIRERDPLPLLNQSQEPGCQVLYRTATNEFCGTAAFDGEGSCGIMAVETRDFLVYQAVLNLPRDSQNDARCECRFDLAETGTAAVPFATWEVDVKAIVAADEEAAKASGLAQTAQVAAEWAQFLGQALN